MTYFHAKTTHLLAIQEHHVNFPSRARVPTAASRRGYSTHFAPDIGGPSQVVLFSRLETIVGDLDLGDNTHANRTLYARIQTDRERILFISVYAHSGSPIHRDQLIDEVVANASHHGHKWIAVGDFNCISSEGAVAHACAQGACRPLTTTTPPPRAPASPVDDASTMALHIAAYSPLNVHSSLVQPITMQSAIRFQPPLTPFAAQSPTISTWAPTTSIWSNKTYGHRDGTKPHSMTTFLTTTWTKHGHTYPTLAKLCFWRKIGKCTRRSY